MSKKITEKDVKNMPSGGAVIGKRQGQTILHKDGTLGGYFTGKTHDEGGIQCIVEETGAPVEIQTGEVIITAPGVADQTKKSFEGEKLTNREILSKINSEAGGVEFADGGEIGNKKYDAAEIDNFANNTTFKTSPSNKYIYFNINKDKQIRITKNSNTGTGKGYHVTIHSKGDDGIGYKSEHEYNRFATSLQEAKKESGKLYFNEIRKRDSNKHDINKTLADLSKISTDQLIKRREKSNDFNEMADITKELKSRSDKKMGNGGEIVYLTDTQKESIAYLSDKIGGINDGKAWALAFYENNLLKVGATIEYYVSIFKLINPKADFINSDKFQDKFMAELERLDQYDKIYLENGGEVKDAPKFDFMKGSPLKQGQALKVLEQKIRSNGEVISTYQWIESFGKSEEIRTARISSKKSEKGYVEKQAIGNHIIDSKSELEYYKYLVACGKSYSEYLSEVAEIDIHNKSIRDKEKAIVDKIKFDQNARAEKYREEQKKIAVKFALTHTRDEFRDYAYPNIVRFKEDIIKLESQRQTIDVADQLKFNRQQIDQWEGIATKNYDRIHLLYKLKDGEVVDRFTDKDFKVGDKIYNIERPSYDTVSKINPNGSIFLINGQYSISPESAIKDQEWQQYESKMEDGGFIYEPNLLSDVAIIDVYEEPHDGTSSVYKAKKQFEKGGAVNKITDSSFTENEENGKEITGYNQLKWIEENGGYIKTDETKIDNDYEVGDPDYILAKAYKVEYKVRWNDNETNSNPDDEIFDTIDAAYKDAQEEGDWWNGNQDHFKRIEPIYKEVWLNSHDVEVEEEESMNGDGFSETDDGAKFINSLEFGKWDNKSEVYIKDFGSRDSNSRELQSEAYQNLGADLETTFKADNGQIYNVKHTGNGKYSKLLILDKNDDEIDNIQLRIADHTYNPANNNDSARDGKFISVEIANENKTKDKFRTSYSLRFDGTDTYEDVLDKVKERLNEILESKVDYSVKEKQFAKGGPISTDKKIKMIDLPVSLQHFIPKIQQKILIGSTDYWHITDRLEDVVKSMPVTFDTAEVNPDEKVLYLHYFYKNIDWYIAEKDPRLTEQIQAYGYCIKDKDMSNAEWGIINIEEIDATKKIELDLFFEPTVFSELKKQFMKEKVIIITEEPIGETKSGKGVYKEKKATDEVYKDFTADDHLDAEKIHHKIYLQLSDMYGSSWSQNRTSTNSPEYVLANQHRSIGNSHGKKYDKLLEIETAPKFGTKEYKAIIKNNDIRKGKFIDSGKSKDAYDKYIDELSICKTEKEVDEKYSAIAKQDKYNDLPISQQNEIADFADEMVENINI